MLTGKIYKNKLSTPQDDYNYQINSETRHLIRVKSQPGINHIAGMQKYENAESIHLGTLKNQRQKIIQQFQNNSHIHNFSKQPQQTLGNMEISASASDQILEYQRKMKDHIQKIQARYEAKISHLQTTLEAKNQIISELKTVLKEKQIIIQKMQQQYVPMGTSRPGTSRYE